MRLRQTVNEILENGDRRDACPTPAKMKTRRAFLKHVAAGVIAAPGIVLALDPWNSNRSSRSSSSVYSTGRAREPVRRKRMAIVTTEWRFHSHAWHIGERFLVGYPSGGAWHRPPIEVVSAYVDQF